MLHTDTLALSTAGTDENVISYLRQGGYVFGSIGLFVCHQDYWKCYERIFIKFAGEVRGGTRNKWLDFGDVLADTDEMRGWNGF